MSLDHSKKNYQNGTAAIMELDSSYPRGMRQSVNLMEGADEIESIGLVAETISEMELPILATANDVREVVKFLKRKASGVTIIEAMNAEPRRIFDARKIAAYEFWGIIERVGDRLKLSELGCELAGRIEPECRIYHQILRSIPTYFGAIQSIHSQNLKIVTHLDMAKYWKQSHPELNLNQLDEKSIEAVAVSFFSLCHAAELGMTTIGKRGQPARMRVEIEQIRDFLNSPEHFQRNFSRPIELKPIYYSDVQNKQEIQPVYLSARHRDAALKHLRSALEIADFNNIMDTYQETVSDNIFPSYSQLAGMQKCRAAVFLLSCRDCLTNQTGELELNNTVLAEISMALALFQRRLLVFWNGAEIAPRSLKQTELHFFNGESFDWEYGVRLVKLLKGLLN